VVKLMMPSQSRAERVRSLVSGASRGKQGSWLLLAQREQPSSIRKVATPTTTSTSPIEHSRGSTIKRLTSAMATATTQPALTFPRETFAKLSPHPYLLAHLQPTESHSRRANGRLPTEFRTPHINNGSLTHAEGSAVVRIGDTTVVCGVRGEILLASSVGRYRADQPATPDGYNEAKELDLLVPNIELATGCSPAFLPGQPPSTLAQSLSTRVYSLLHSSKLVDSELLKIWYQPPDLSDQNNMDDDVPETIKPEVKAFWTLYIDILFISLDGNPFDAAWAAVVSALNNVRLPKANWDPDREMIICEDSLRDSKSLLLKGTPVAVTALVFRAKEQAQASDVKHWILVDPDTFEEGLCDESVTVLVDCSGGETKMLGTSKLGGTIIAMKEMREIVSLAEARWNTLSKLLKG
jgi:exosome complex component RRP43